MMRKLARFGAAAVLLSFVGIAVGGHGARSVAHAQTVKNIAHVAIIDSAVTFDAAGIEYEGAWGFGPEHVQVTQGEPIEFDSSSSNNYPHTVTSITWSGTPNDRTLISGAAFNSTPSADMRLMPGSSFTLDTSSLNPGQYVYYCTIHPWMVGTISVTAPQ